MIIRPLRLITPLALLTLTLASCGGAPLRSSDFPQEPLPATADAALEMVNRAEGDLRLALGSAPPPGAAPASPTAAQPPAQAGAAPPPPPPSPSAAAPSATPAPPEVTFADSPMHAEARPADDPCANACRALASMARATAHLCTLAGDADARCEDARTRVKTASARVQAECPACAGSREPR